MCRDRLSLLLLSLGCQTSIGEGNHTGSEIDPEATALPRKKVDRPLPKGMLGVLLMEDTSGYCP